jgi:hypothetical protein
MADKKRKPLKSYVGMTLREYYAGQAMKGYRSAGGGWTDLAPHDIARYAVRDADALIEELKKGIR